MSDVLTHAYMAAGAFATLRNEPATHDLSAFEGELGFIDAVLSFACAIDAQFEALEAVTDYGHEDVFAYEHAEPMGEWVAMYMLHHNHVPAEHDVLRKARWLYFEHCPGKNEVESDTLLNDLKREGRLVTLRSSYGDLYINRTTGEIAHIDFDGNDGDSFKDIIAFDPRDMVEIERNGETDILDVGFWDQTGNYCAARKDIGEQQ